MAAHPTKVEISTGRNGLLVFGAVVFGAWALGSLFHFAPNPGTPLTQPLATPGTGPAPGTVITSQGYGGTPTTVSGGTPTVANPSSYVVQPGDTLSGISAKFYGTAAYWPGIYLANQPAIGPNPNVLHTGLVLIIPARSTAAALTQLYHG
jgi:nucleoid-associated protein YgaU